MFCIVSENMSCPILIGVLYCIYYTSFLPWFYFFFIVYFNNFVVKRFKCYNWFICFFIVFNNGSDGRFNWLEFLWFLLRYIFRYGSTLPLAVSIVSASAAAGTEIVLSTCIWKFILMCNYVIVKRHFWLYRKNTCRHPSAATTATSCPALKKFDEVSIGFEILKTPIFFQTNMRIK